jgi:hypothetical protein
VIVRGWSSMPVPPGTVSGLAVAVLAVVIVRGWSSTPVSPGIVSGLAVTVSL